MTEQEVKEDYEFLKEYHESNLIMLVEFLEELDLNKPVSNILNAIKKELDRRKNITDEFVNTLKEKYLNKYIRYNYNDGLGTYTIFKVTDIKKTKKEYCDLYYSVKVSNVDGNYTIESFENASLKIYCELEQERIEVITEDEYKEEFNKAIEYYKSLGK